MSKRQNSSTWVIARRELAAYWTSPAAYIVTGLFLIFSGVLFFSAFFLNGRAELRNFFNLLPILLALFTPALTMRLFSEEIRSGSFETLMTLPVRVSQVVLGKFIAAFLTSAAMLLPTLFYVVTACIFGKPDFGPIVGGYIGALFLCAAFSAIGIFASAWTKNQIIAFFTALAISVALTMLGGLLVFVPSGAVKFLSWISVGTHFSSVARGIVDSRDVLYFVSVAAIFILFTIRRFVINWKKSDSADFVLAAAILVLANLVGARAFFRADLTHDRLYSISKASKETVRNLTEPLSVNVFFSSDLPAPYNSVEQYLRDILIEYKATANENFSYKFFDMNKDESAETARSYGLRQTQVQRVETTEVTAKAVWMSAALVYGDDIRTFDNINSSSGLEYKLTTSITKMISSSDALASLKSGMTLTLYPAAELKAQIAGLSKLESRVAAAVSELNKKFGGQINFRVMSADGEEAAALGDKYGIQPISYGTENGDERTTALGLVLELNGEFRTIPLQLADLGFLGWHLIGTENIQEDLDSSIESLLSKTVEIGYVTGHGENSLNGDPYRNGQIPTSENFRAVLNDIYTLKEINLSEEEIPLNINCLVINGPKEKFSELELFKIDQFVMKGGNLLLTLDPLVESMENGPNAPPAYTKPDTGLDALLDSYGIKGGANYVMDENCYEAKQQDSPGGGTKLNWAPLLFREQINRRNPITKYITGMIFLQSGSIDISAAQKDAALSAEVLAKSSEKSWTASENIILYPGYIFPPDNKDEIHENNLAVLVEGKFKSAFTGKAVPAEINAKAEEAAGEAGTEAETAQAQNAASASIKAREKLENGIQKARIVFVNSSMVTTSQLVDAGGNEPMAYFLRNAVDYLNGAKDYCEMRTKGTTRNLLEIKSNALATAFRLLNQFGLAVMVALVGLLVWRLRSVRRNEIRIKYNADDEREISSGGEK